jgi:hypothetical protein
LMMDGMSRVVRVSRGRLDLQDGYAVLVWSPQP